MEIIERPTDTLITLTPVAASKIRELLAEEPDGEALVLRVAIQGGGCSGFQYGLGFDSAPAEGDHELELEGIPVVVDPFSAPYLQGTTIDFLTGLQESGFKIDNPNAVSSCGCGHSFQVAEGEELPEGTARGRLRRRLQPLARLLEAPCKPRRGRICPARSISARTSRRSTASDTRPRAT